jgi:hypothetical protein
MNWWPADSDPTNWQGFAADQNVAVLIGSSKISLYQIVVPFKMGTDQIFVGKGGNINDLKPGAYYHISMFCACDILYH